jgi:hypothetical protein
MHSMLRCHHRNENNDDHEGDGDCHDDGGDDFVLKIPLDLYAAITSSK